MARPTTQSAPAPSYKASATVFAFCQGDAKRALTKCENRGNHNPMRGRGRSPNHPDPHRAKRKKKPPPKPQPKRPTRPQDRSTNNDRPQLQQSSEPSVRILQIDPPNLRQPPQPIPKRIRMHINPPSRSRNIPKRIQISPQSLHQMPAVLRIISQQPSNSPSRLVAPSSNDVMQIK